MEIDEDLAKLAQDRSIEAIPQRNPEAIPQRNPEAILQKNPEAIPQKNRPKREKFKEDEQKLLREAPDLNQQEFKHLLNRLNEAYHNDVGLVSDAVYDDLRDLYQEKFGPYNYVGALPRRSKVELPYYLGSLRKIMISSKIQSWSLKYPGPYVLEDKVDGLTLLYYQSGDERKLYTRGNGEIGQDVSHLLPYLPIPSAPVNVAIRGEIVMNKEEFLQYGEGFSNPRAMTSGLINSKNNYNPDLLRHLNFYPFLILNADETPEIQIGYLKEWGYTPPHAVLTLEINQEFLTDYLLRRKGEAPYEMDGLVIYQNKIIEYPIGENPKDVIAFKIPAEIKETQVLGVIWQPSEHRRLKPVVLIKPVYLAGAELKQATGYNARYIITNQIGPGARIMVSRSKEVTPRIISVITPAPGGPSYPNPEKYGEYHWNPSHVELVLDHPTEEVVQAQLKKFLTKLGIKNLGPGRIKALYEAGFNTPYKLITATPEEFQRTEKFGSSLAHQTYKEIHQAITNVPLPVLMSATRIFPGFGEKKFEVILDHYPNILKMHPLDVVREIALLPGFSIKTAEVFAENLPLFKQWLHDHPMVTYQPYHSMRKETHVVTEENLAEHRQDLVGERFVFSGFRDKPLENEIKSRGGSVGTSISRNTTLLVVKNPNDLKSKGEKAKELGIPIMSLSHFKERYTPE